MINLSEDPLLIGSGEIDKKVKFACSQVLATMSEQEVLRKRKEENLKNKPFRTLVKNHIKKFDENFIRIAYEYSNQAVTPSNNNEISQQFFEYFGPHSFNAKHIGILRADLKVLFMQLWLNGDLILPITYKLTINRKYKVPDDHELYKFIESFYQSDGDTKSSQHLGDRIFYYASRILRSTDWRRIQDFKLDDWAQLHSLSIKGENDSKYSNFHIPKTPWTGMINELLSRHPNAVQFNQNDIQIYSEWSLSRIKTLDFATFRDNWMPNDQRVQAPRKPRIRPKKEESTIDGYIDSLKEMGAGLNHEDILQYFKKLKPNSKLLSTNSDEVDYIGREYVDIRRLSKTWVRLFKQYKSYRLNHLGYESDKGVTSSLNLLLDYICLYLPWWKELYPDGKVVIPEYPKEFKRAYFVHRTNQSTIDSMPLTLVQVIQLKRTNKDTLYAALNQIHLFFSYLESYHTDDEEVGAGFRNPVTKFDLPKLKKRTKTSKLNFPQRTIGYLQYFAYSVEAFGEYLYEMSINPAGFLLKPNLNKSKLSSVSIFDTQEFGYVPVFFFKGKVIPLLMVPNAFCWKSSLISTKVGTQLNKFIPYLTTVRAFIVGIENGLRFAGIRWLDKNKWDKLNVGEPREPEFTYYPKTKYSYKLTVSTDKVKDEEWSTTIVYRVRSMLHREENFWSNIVIPENESGEVPYQLREISRFPNITPLFKSAQSKMPITENMVQDYWVIFMSGFQHFFNSVTDGEPIIFVKLNPVGGDKTKTLINKESGCLFTPLSLLAVSTPHACRSTFCTDKGQFLEVDDVANMVGHENKITTYYYQSLRSEDAVRKFEDLDKTLMSIDSTYYDV